MLAQERSRFPDVLGFVLGRMSRWPRRVLDGFGYVAYVVTYHVLRWSRRLSLTNLDNAFPEKTPAERAEILRQSYRNLGSFLAEALWGWNASAEALAERVRIVNPELIARFTSRGQSVVLLAAHFCNWEWLLLAAGAHLELPIDVVYKPLHQAGVDAYVREARRRFGANPIPHRSFLYEVMRRGDEPRAYALLADQTPLARAPKHWLTFLNRDTAFFLGPEQIARYLDATVVYVEMRRAGRGRYAVHLDVIAEPPYGDDAGVEIVERYARRLEATILASPADWLWIHNKWKYARPDVAGSVSGVAVQSKTR
jgi:KDO2-lipid IV(A) lauroyltransferase